LAKLHRLGVVLEVSHRHEPRRTLFLRDAVVVAARFTMVGST